MTVETTESSTLVTENCENVTESVTEVVTESVTEAEEVVGKSAGDEIIAEAEAAVSNLKFVKRGLRQTELTDLEKAELTDAMEEIAVQYGKIQGLYQTTKERIVKVAKVIGGCLVVAVVVFGVVKLVL